MPSISRQYHPPSCRLEITAKISALSRWAQRPILQSVNFLLSFPEISGKHHEPLEIRGDREQLQLLSDTVANYVQGIVGQSLQTSVFNAAAAPAKPANAIEAMPSTISDEKRALSAHPHPPVLHSRTLLTHELVLGALATNAENPSVCLKTSQLFDLVSALDDCADELEILPLPTPTRKPRIPVWASSAAMVVLTLGVTTATLQITQQPPSETDDLVTTAADRSDQPNQPNQPIPSAEIDGVASAPTASSKSQAPSPTSVPSASSKPKTQSPTTASKEAPSPSPAITTTPTTSPETSFASPLVTLAPRQKRQAPSPTKPSPSLAQPKPEPPTTNPNSQPKDEGKIALTDKPAHNQPGSTSGNPTSQNAKLPNRPIAASPVAPSASTSEAAPVNTDTNAETETLHESDHLDGPSTGTDDRKSLNQLGRQAPSTFARTRDLQPQALEIRQYISERWRAPAGLSQPLQYQLTLNSNGSLSQVNPLDPTSAQYLGQVPLPAVNRPFISPLKSPSTPRIRLVLSPDGTVRTSVEPQVTPPTNK